MNSFRAVERAIAFEIERQAVALDAGETLTQETRGWDDGRQATYVMRSKEDSHDYRYFPEPDLPPLRVDVGVARRRSARACPSSRPRGGPATGRARPVRVRRRGDRGRTGDDGRVRGDPGRRAGARPPRRSRTWSPATTAGRPRSNRRRTPDGLVGRAERRADGRPAASRRRGRAVAGERARRSSSSTSSTGRAVADDRRSSRPAPDLRRRRARARSSTTVLAANPGAVADHRAGKPSLGFLVGQVMKATARPGERRARPGRPPRAPRRRRLGRGLSGGPDQPRRCGSAAPSLLVARLRRARAARGRATRSSRPQDANVARYEAWRGGVRDDAATTGASVAMEILRRQAQIGAAIAARRARRRSSRGFVIR